MATELLDPAERFVYDLDSWANTTLTSKLKNAILEVINSTRARLEGELPFYQDILLEDANTTALAPPHPVVFIPGYITGGLEIWAALPCVNSRFRERIWGTASMIKLFITDPHCWVQHMVLQARYEHLDPAGEPLPGSVHFQNPSGIKIMPTSGLAAADFLLGDYWVWNPIIEALGYAGFDETSMSMMAYDWRLSLRDLETRDKFMTHTKLEIEKMYQMNDNQTVLVISHSYGCKVWFFFMQWVSHHYSPEWLSKYVYGSYNVAPAHLGVPKALSALLSGDTRDTAQLGAMATFLDTILPPTDRSALTASWGSITDMLPLGGKEIWPHPIVHLRTSAGANTAELYIDEAVEVLMQTRAMKPHAIHRAGEKGDLRCPSANSPKRMCYKDAWVNPLQSPLPKMKSKIWVAYGIGIATEVGYHYTNINGNLTDNSAFRVNVTATDLPDLVAGIFLSDGDGTVPKQSLSYLPSHAWKIGSKLNPGDVHVGIRELRHGESYSVLSRANSVGGSSVDHVDIMGNRIVIRDILQIALGKEHMMEEIREVSDEQPNSSDEL
jgi:phospholipid:diacylglycerol acyltransferase